MARSTRANSIRSRGRSPRWSDLSDAQLLKLRLCDLKLTLRGSWLEPHVDRLYEELDERGILLHPHAWLSSEWFSPDGIPGIAAPFYLAHPRLFKLEKKMMLEVEGGTDHWCMRLLRHEAGHAISTAYRLHFKKRWRKAFGKVTTPYPEYYRPKPNSRDFVVHLDCWYAQAHPAEDFAETFAVWLNPRSRWRQTYRGWPALRKLQLVDELMSDIADELPKVRSRKQIEPISQLKVTLADHYREKRLQYATEWPEFYDRDLRLIFSDEPAFAGNESAAKFLRHVRPEVRRIVSKWTGEYQYTIDQVLRDMIDRCKELRLRLAVPKSDAQRDTMIMVAVQTMNYLHGGRHRIAL